MFKVGDKVEFIGRKGIEYPYYGAYLGDVGTIVTIFGREEYCLVKFPQCTIFLNFDVLEHFQYKSNKEARFLLRR